MQEILFWFVVLLLIYGQGGYLLLLAVIASFFPKKIVSTSKDWEWPSITIIIPAYNEEGGIREKIENCRKIEYPSEKLQIIVVSDNSTDRTDEIIQDACEGFRGLKYLRVEGRRGKTYCQNVAAEHAQGDILIFSDADSFYYPDAIFKLVRNYSSPCVGGVSGRYRYVDLEKSSVGKSTGVFWEYENLIKRFQSRIYTLTGASGCIYSIRRNLYSPLPAHISSDIIEPITVVRKGYIVRFEEEAMAIEKSTSRLKQEFRMRVRVVTGGIIGLYYVKDLLNPIRHPWIAFQLFSHKVCRWVLPCFLILLYALSGLLMDKHWIYTAAFFGQNSIFLLAGIGWILDRRGLNFKIFSLPLFFVIGNAAILASLFRICTGYKAVTWETERAATGR